MPEPLPSACVIVNKQMSRSTAEERLEERLYRICPRFGPQQLHRVEPRPALIPGLWRIVVRRFGQRGQCPNFSPGLRLRFS